MWRENAPSQSNNYYHRKILIIMLSDFFTELYFIFMKSDCDDAVPIQILSKYRRKNLCNASNQSYCEKFKLDLQRRC